MGPFLPGPWARNAHSLTDRRASLRSRIVTSVPIIWALYQEIVLVSIERNDEFILKTFSSKNSLKGHLKCSVCNESHASCPRKFWVMREAQVNILELDMPSPT